LATFDTKITQDSLADTFRIFNDKIRGSKLAPNTKMEPEPDEEPITVFTDGSALENDTESARACSGIFFGPEDSRNAAIKIPDELEPSNQVGEIIAIKEAIERCPADIPMTIYSDSKYIRLLTYSLWCCTTPNNTKKHMKMPQHATPTTLGLKYTTPVMVHCCRASAVDQN
jgi:hypothetical protein